MNSNEFVVFLFQICIMLTFALFFGQIAKKLRQPPVLGELVGGIILGPTVFGAIAPHVYSHLFPIEGFVYEARDVLVKLGMLFFLFVAGLEIHISHIFRNKAKVFLTSASSIALPFFLGFCLVMLSPGMWGIQAEMHTPLFAIFLGTALSISALPVIVRIFMDLDLMHEEIGVIVVASATLNDIIGWSMFAVLLSSFSRNGISGTGIWLTFGLVLGLAALILFMGNELGQSGLSWLQRKLSWPSSFIAVMIILALMASSATEIIGIHSIFGAFLVGIALGQNSKERKLARDVVHEFAMSFFVPLYFVSIGLNADFIQNFDLGLVLIVLLVACIGKILGAYAGARLGGIPSRKALAIGFGMNARGAMEMILATIAFEYGLIEERIFVSLIVMALVTSILSGPLIQRLLPKGS